MRYIGTFFFIIVLDYYCVCIIMCIIMCIIIVYRERVNRSNERNFFTLKKGKK